MKVLDVIFVNIFILLLLLKSTLQFDLRIKYYRTDEEANGAKYYAIDFIGLIEQHGRQMEWHNVTTEDGYVLPLFRIPPNPRFKNQKNNRTFFLGHGLMATADIFIIYGPGRSLPYYLSDAGYDVWIGNLRGCNYGRTHKVLTPDDKKFWDFNLDDYANKDLPASIDYVLEATDQSTISFLGHSLGSTLILILLSDKPEYNAKLNLVTHFAPVAYWKDWTISRILLAIGSFFLETFIPGGRFEIIGPTVPSVASIDFCLWIGIPLIVCEFPLDLILGGDREQLNEHDALITLKHYPAGTSIQTMQHYGQHVRSGEFRHFKYETKDLNIEKYGTETPPEYNLTNIRTPTIIFRGKNDPMSTENMNLDLIQRLPDDIEVIYEVIEYDKFNHRDFIGAIDVEELFYNRMLEIFEDFFNRRKIDQLTN